MTISFKNKNFLDSTEMPNFAQNKFKPSIAINMIRTNPNPPMTKMDVARFGVVMRKALTKDYSPRERKRIEERKAQMKLAGEIIRRNNGGKDPILGFQNKD